MMMGGAAFGGVAAIRMTPQHIVAPFAIEPAGVVEFHAIDHDLSDSASA